MVAGGEEFGVAGQCVDRVRAAGHCLLGVFPFHRHRHRHTLTKTLPVCSEHLHFMSICLSYLSVYLPARFIRIWTHACYCVMAIAASWIYGWSMVRRSSRPCLLYVTCVPMSKYTWRPFLLSISVSSHSRDCLLACLLSVATREAMHFISVHA